MLTGPVVDIDRMDIPSSYEPMGVDFLERLPTASAEDGPSYLGDGRPVVADEAAWHGVHRGDMVMRFKHRTNDVRHRVGAISAMDGQNRVSMQKVLKFMLWDDGIDLVTQRHDATKVVIRERTSEDGARVGEASFDSTGRLVLSSAVRMALSINSGDRVQVVGQPADGLIYLMSEQDALAAMTAPTAAECAATPRPNVPSTHSRNTRVRKARY